MKKSATLYTNRGVVNQYMGDTYAASADYQAAIRLDPKYPLAHFNIGNLEFHQRLFGHAIRSYSKALSYSFHEDDSFLVNRAIAFAMTKQIVEALDDFEHAVKINPYSAYAYFNRGNLYKSIGKYGEAMEDYRKGR